MHAHAGSWYVPMHMKRVCLLYQRRICLYEMLINDRLLHIKAKFDLNKME